MTKAVWKETVIAESDQIVPVEGNAYFPENAVNWDMLRESRDTQPTYCHWKGVSGYFDIVVGSAVNLGAAWRYPAPHDEAAAIRGHVAFWNGVEITGAPEGRGLIEQTPSIIKDKTGWKALCWQLKFAEDPTLSKEQVTQRTGISAAEAHAAWTAYDVQRYARMYKWRLIDGTARGASPWLEKFADA